MKVSRGDLMSLAKLADDIIRVSGESIFSLPESKDSALFAFSDGLLPKGDYCIYNSALRLFERWQVMYVEVDMKKVIEFNVRGALYKVPKLTQELFERKKIEFVESLLKGMQSEKMKIELSEDWIALGGVGREGIEAGLISIQQNTLKAELLFTDGRELAVELGTMEKPLDGVKFKLNTVEPFLDKNVGDLYIVPKSEKLPLFLVKVYENKFYKFFATA